MSSKRRNKKRMIMEQKKREESVTGRVPEAGQEQDVPETGTVPAPDGLLSSVVIPAKKEIEKTLFLQYNDLEFSDRLMFEAAINDYCQKAGVPAGEVTSVNLYVKPQEGKAYYVINHDGEKNGSIDL